MSGGRERRADGVGGWGDVGELAGLDDGGLGWRTETMARVMEDSADAGQDDAG